MVNTLAFAVASQVSSVKKARGDVGSIAIVDDVVELGVLFDMNTTVRPKAILRADFVSG